MCKVEKAVKGFPLLAIFVMLVVFAASCGRQEQSATTGAAEKIVNSMANGDFASATADFNAVMKSQLPAVELERVWTQLTAQVGPFKAQSLTREAQEQGFDVVYVTCQFEKSSMDAKVVFDSNRQVTGLFMVPSQSPPGAR